MTFFSIFSFSFLLRFSLEKYGIFADSGAAAHVAGDPHLLQGSRRAQRGQAAQGTLDLRLCAPCQSGWSPGSFILMAEETFLTCMLFLVP